MSLMKGPGDRGCHGNRGGGYWALNCVPLRFTKVGTLAPYDGSYLEIMSITGN